MIHLNLGIFIVQTILMHDPICLLAVRSTAYVKHQSLSHANSLGVAKVNGFVPPSRLPESG